MSKAKKSKKIEPKKAETLKPKIKVDELDEYTKWFDKETDKSKAQIDKRIAKIELKEYFGDVKDLGEGLAELRWRNGRRIYFTSTGKKIVLLLIGGNKNGQSKDIKKARLLIRKNAEDQA